MPAISDDKIEEVRSASDLVDVVSDYVRLKKQGARFVGLCPFHSERSPSFSVDPRANLYHCFGCKAGGDVFRFVQDKEGVGFLDAVRLLAERGGIALPEEEAPSPEADEREAILAALRFAARFYFDRLKSPEGQRGLDYLRERGFTKEAVLAFGIGYAPDAWDALATAALRAGHRPETLERAGLARPRAKGEGHYDLFRDRVMFPILSPVGKVLGFGGRIVPGARPMPDGGEPAKYINTAETPVYHKAEVLYGLKQAKQAIRAADEAILVEGYADVVSLHQAGVTNVVAASGTALTPQQVRLLKSFARTVVLLYDADAAGQAAAARGIETVLAEGMAVYLVTLPDGADPDSFVRQFGAEAFMAFLARERQDFPAFLAAAARRAGLLDTPEGKAEAASRLVDAVAHVGSEIARDAYLLRAAEELRIPDAQLRPLLRARARREAAEASRPARTPHPAESGPEPPAAHPLVMRPDEGELLRLMLQHGAPMVEHVLSRMAVEEFSEGTVRTIVVALIAQYEADAVETEAFERGDFGEAVQRLAAQVTAEQHAISVKGAAKRGKDPERRDARPFVVATEAMRQLKLARIAEALADVKRQIYEAEQEGRDLTALLRTHAEFDRLRADIERGRLRDWNPG